MSEHELWNELGNLYFLSGSYDQAANAYRRSIQMDAGFGRPYSNLALTYVQQGKFEEAVELYRRSIELLTENKEKAVSWNRLGTVYRHLKDYSKAVIAFQEADELDPQSAAELPLVTEAQHDKAPELSSILDEAPAAPNIPEVEWWEIDEKRVEAATHTETALSPVEVSHSWVPADLGQYQQDVSQIPAASSLTSWDEPELEDEFEVFSPGQPEAGPDLPEPDDDVSTWLPIPEEDPWSGDQLEVPPFLDDIELEWMEPEPDWDNSIPYRAIEMADFAAPAPIQDSAPAVLEAEVPPESLSGAQISTTQTHEERQPEIHADVMVEVEERPAPEIRLPAEELTEPVEAACMPELEPMPAAVYEAASLTEAPVFDREADELREIEMGIAKFKRVVQLNPRNAHAWDALGTLYKSAGLYKDAILAYQQAISNDSSKSLYYHHLGLVYACEGRDEDAISAFQKVIEIDPEYSLAHATLGGYYRKMGLEELAQKHIGKAMKNIFDSENEYNRACLEAICGNADQAIELLGVALKNKQTYVDWILRDPDLDFIRQDPRFKKLISDYTR